VVVWHINSGSGNCSLRDLDPFEHQVAVERRIKMEVNGL
jgi:hypothetical protein